MKEQVDISVQQDDKNKKKKKIIWIVVIITIIICLCCTISGVLGYKGASALIDQSNEVKSELLIDMCNNKDIMSQSDYENWFTSDFRSSRNILEATEILDEMFPIDMICEDLYVDGVFDALKKGQTFTYSVSTYGGTTADLTYPTVGGEIISIHMVQIDSEWKIDSYSVTHN